MTKTKELNVEQISILIDEISQPVFKFFLKRFEGIMKRPENKNMNIDNLIEFYVNALANIDANIMKAFLGNIEIKPGSPDPSDSIKNYYYKVLQNYCDMDLQKTPMH